MAKTMQINGVTFELTIPRKEAYAIGRDKWDYYNAIFECYKRPSIYKQGIWEDWFKWAVDTIGVRSFYISGYNNSQFSISGLYEDAYGIQYNLYITRDHNRATLVNA